LTDISKVQAGEAKPEDSAQFGSPLDGGHVVGRQRVGAFHLWVSVSRPAVPNDGAETEKPDAQGQWDTDGNRENRSWRKSSGATLGHF